MMRRLALACVLALVAVEAYAQATDPRIVFVQRSLAREYDPSLPAQPMAAWLKGTLPKGATIRWAMAECEDEAATEDDADQAATVPCVAAVLEAPGRSRTVELRFIPATREFASGVMASPDAADDVPVNFLTEVAIVFKTPLDLVAIECPAGTDPFLLEQNGATFEGCERGGAIDGFYRSWFEFGVRLMEKGQFANGTKVGRWTQCDGAGRCQEVAY